MEFEKYIFTKPKPQYPSKPVLMGKTPKDHRDYADKLEAWQNGEKDYKVEMNKWYQERTDLHNQFKHDLLNELNILNHPKSEKLFQMAWDERNYDGLPAVYDYAYDLAELVRSN